MSEALDKISCKASSIMALLEMLENYAVCNLGNEKAVMLMANYIPAIQKAFDEYSREMYEIAEKAEELVEWHEKNVK